MQFSHMATCHLSEPSGPTAGMYPRAPRPWWSQLGPLQGPILRDMQQFNTSSMQKQNTLINQHQYFMYIYIYIYTHMLEYI